LINAHTSPLAAISFDMSGTRIATASTKVCDRNLGIMDLFKYVFLLKGTVIRIHNVSNGSCLFEFRRGVRRYVSVICQYLFVNI
jgi:autophagy-related protein 18